jgi:hypothetical protein
MLHVRRLLEVSERRARRSSRQPRSRQRYCLNRPDKNKALWEEILRLEGKEKRAWSAARFAVNCGAMVGQLTRSACFGFG